MKALFLTMAQANRWANQLLYPELGKLSPVQWMRERGVNFGGVMGIANHQTHHRGQLHALLGVEGIACPNLDLIYYQAAQRGATA